MEAKTKRIVHLLLLDPSSPEEVKWVLIVIQREISVTFKQSSLYAAKHSHLDKKSKV